MELHTDAEIQRDFLEEINAEPEIDDTPVEAYISEAVEQTANPVLGRGDVTGSSFLNASEALYNAIKNGNDGHYTFQRYGEKWGEHLLENVDNPSNFDQFIQQENIFRELAGRTVSRDNRFEMIKHVLRPDNVARGIYQTAKHIGDPSEIENYTHFDAELNGYTIDDLADAADQGYRSAVRSMTGETSAARTYNEWMNESESATEAAEPLSITKPAPAHD